MGIKQIEKAVRCVDLELRRETGMCPPLVEAMGTVKTYPGRVLCNEERTGQRTQS